MKKSFLLVLFIQVLVGLTNAQESIHNVSKVGNIDSAKKILSLHPDWINLKDNSGLTPLHYAATSSLELVEYLILKGATVNEKSKKGVTPLYTAARFGKIEIAKYLLEHNADINIFGEGGTALHQAVYRAPIEMVILFLSYKPDLRITDADGSTVVHAASIWNNDEVLKLLISAGAELNTKDKKGNTPLHKCLAFADATSKGSLKAAKILIENKALLSETNNNNETPLALAIRLGAIEFQTMLIEAGAKN